LQNNAIFSRISRESTRNPAKQNVGHNPDLQQLLDAMLRRFRFHLPPGSHLGHQGQVNVEHVLAAHVQAELPDRFQKGNAFDVPDRPSDFHDMNIRFLLGRRLTDSALDLVGDMGNHLHGLPQIAPGPLPLEHLLVNLPRADAVQLRQPNVREALVIAQVQIGLRPVVGHVDLAMLVGTHGARIDVDVGIDLLKTHAQSPLLQHRSSDEAATPLPSDESDPSRHKNNGSFESPQKMISASGGLLKTNGPAALRPIKCGLSRVHECRFHRARKEFLHGE
jgi:hypothetical protein